MESSPAKPSAARTVPFSAQRPSVGQVIRSNLGLIVLVLLLAALPFVIALLDGQSIAAVVANEAGNSKFLQGLLIEVFILAVYAISYDLILGVTGLLSFGQAMFFAVGAYVTGIMLKSFDWGLVPTIGAVMVAGVLQALLFGIVLPRVKGITFALVTLGLASVFEIMVKTQELVEYTGSDVGLQGIPKPDVLNPADQRLRFYFVALGFAVLVYLVFRRFVDSPTGRVCVATRENENRALMLGFNTFHFKLAALMLASIAAALAGLLHALFKPIVSPEIAGLGFTVEGLLMILIGGIGTLSGAMLGAGVFRLLDFYLAKWFGESASFILGAIYVAIVLFLPYGIVGTWRLRRWEIRSGWQRLLAYVTGGDRDTADSS
jgi:branched-chain amino acid transport system permease protein